MFMIKLTLIFNAIILGCSSNYDQNIFTLGNYKLGQESFVEISFEANQTYKRGEKILKLLNGYLIMMKHQMRVLPIILNVENRRIQLVIYPKQRFLTSYIFGFSEVNLFVREDLAIDYQLADLKVIYFPSTLCDKSAVLTLTFQYEGEQSLASWQGQCYLFFGDIQTQVSCQNNPIKRQLVVYPKGFDTIIPLTNITIEISSFPIFNIPKNVSLQRGIADGSICSYTIPVSPIRQQELTKKYYIQTTYVNNSTTIYKYQDIQLTQDLYKVIITLLAILILVVSILMILYLRKKYHWNLPQRYRIYLNFVAKCMKCWQNYKEKNKLSALKNDEKLKDAEQVGNSLDQSNLNID
ncbi:UNKNOWN [Stylonychia lemnae]|uniref:Transmembrane protein n=1 Tax=Stylonychia lemnae TaxID=5949 RepID=A0A077ZRN7_STYLE|nr:UNKNOWN [Stylonychia lemnae]|eukprot:CDW72000.1 UNKNOWN [Stylonychia lemnae]